MQNCMSRTSTQLDFSFSRLDQDVLSTRGKSIDEDRSTLDSLVLSVTSQSAWARSFTSVVAVEVSKVMVRVVHTAMTVTENCSKTYPRRLKTDLK